MSRSTTALTRPSARAALLASSTLASRGCKEKIADLIGSSMSELARKLGVGSRLRTNLQSGVQELVIIRLTAV